VELCIRKLNDSVYGSSIQKLACLWPSVWTRNLPTLPTTKLASYALCRDFRQPSVVTCELGLAFTTNLPFIQSVLVRETSKYENICLQLREQTSYLEHFLHQTTALSCVEDKVSYRLKVMERKKSTLEKGTCQTASHGRHQELFRSKRVK
jgi:hypothetical protein